MDYLIEFLVWSLAVFGATNIIVSSSILQPVRMFLMFSRDGRPRRFSLLGKLVTCIMCMGFWVGLLFSMAVWSPSSNHVLAAVNYSDWFRMLYDGCLGSCVSWLLYLLIKDKQFNS
jgi:hypothetical protein